jgi:hypothetical protein
MQSSMKIILFILAAMMILVYLYGLTKRKESRELLLTGTISAGDEKLALSEVLSQARFFLVCVLFFNACIWLLCFVNLSQVVGLAGVLVSFADFVINYEVVGKVVSVGYTESSVEKVLSTLKALALASLCCYGAMLLKIFGVF